MNSTNEKICENNEKAKKPLVDPMAFDTEDNLEVKKQKWNDIFQRCPDFADFIIDFFDAYGEEGIGELMIMRDPKTGKHSFGCATPAPGDAE